MIKKIFIITLIVLGITLFFWGVYNFAFSNKNAKNANIEDTNVSIKKEGDMFSDIGTDKKGIVAAVSDEGVVSAAYVKDSEMIRYYAVDGRVWDVNTDASGKKSVADEELVGLQSVTWSPDGVQVISTFDKKGKTEFYTYNYANGKGTKLKENLDTVKWDGIGAKIIYKYFDSQKKERTLNVADPDGSNWKKIVDIPFKHVSVSAVPQSSNISFWNSPWASEETQLFVVGIGGTDLKKIFGGKFGADYLWSPNGQHAIISSLEEENSKKIVLGIIDKNGEYKNLGIPTFASKCVWSSDNKTVYYALPGGIPENVVIPNDYLAEKFNTVDTFWKINIETGKKERIVELNELSEKYDASKIFLSNNEDALFFINKIDSKIYKIKL